VEYNIGKNMIKTGDQHGWQEIADKEVAPKLTQWIAPIVCRGE
jgi:hypothetical protein